MMTQSELVPYNPARFDGSAASYAGQGVCSKCHTRAAEWMNKKATRAYCDNCKPKELKGEKYGKVKSSTSDEACSACTH